MNNQDQQPKPKKEQIKIAFKKILIYQREQKKANKNENNGRKEIK
jgi:hypothetical protein